MGDFLVAVGVIVFVAFIGSFTNYLGKNTIVDSCQEIGAFSANGVVYECRPRAKTQ